MIVVRLMGGLGNQLFQYAFAKHLSVLNNCELGIDISGLKHDGDAFSVNFTNREYYLDHYNTTIIKPLSKSYLKRFKGFWKRIHTMTGKKYQYIKEHNTTFDQQMLAIKDNTLVEGYWQSEKYFKGIEHVIRKDLTLKKEIHGQNKTIAEKIALTRSVSLHVRRGDYVSNPVFSKVLGACQPDYYERAIGLMNEKIENPTYFIFSDDIPWAKENLNFKGRPATFVTNNNEAQCFEDLRLMSMCENNIIANSSFSWWGAWLNAQAGKIIIVPEKWFNDLAMCDDDLIPAEWVKV